MNGFDKFALAAAVVMTFLYRNGAKNGFEMYIMGNHVSGPMVAVAGAGWLISTYGPLALAAWFWRWSKRARLPWVLHLWLAPCALILLVTGGWIVSTALRARDFDDTIGDPMIGGALLLPVAVGGYVVALAFRLTSQKGPTA